MLRLMTLAVVLLGSLAWRASAQSNVYSLNIVGYANVPAYPGYNLIENPFDDQNGNLVTNVIPAPPDSSTVFLWDVPTQAFTPYTTYYDGLGWDTPSISLPPGRGFFFYTDFAYTNTFVGQVLQGALTNFVAGNNKLSALGSKVPQAGLLSTDLGFPTIDGANAFLFNGASQTYTDAFTCFSGFGWFDPNGVAGTGGPSISVGQAIFVQNPGPDVNWVRNFTAGLASLQGAKEVVILSQQFPMVITSLQITNASVALKVQTSPGNSYSVQFSTNGSSWSTVASGQTASVWLGTYLGGRLGLYRLSQP